MTELIAILSTGKGTWANVSKIINDGGFSKTFIITNDFGAQNFTKRDNMDIIALNFEKPIKDLSADMVNALKDKVSGTEAGINFISGAGKEHMALMAAVMKLGLNFRLIILTEQGKIDEVNPYC